MHKRQRRQRHPSEPHSALRQKRARGAAPCPPHPLQNLNCEPGVRVALKGAGNTTTVSITCGHMPQVAAGLLGCIMASLITGLRARVVPRDELSLSVCSFRAAALFLAVACVAFGEPAQALGQAHNATTHAQLADEIARLNERIGDLESGMEGRWSQSPTMTIIIAIAAGVAASTHSAYLVEWLSRHRLRPVLAWSTFEKGRKLAKRNLPDGIPVIMVRMTNVGQVAAVDVVSRTRIRISKPNERGVLRRTKPDSLGSLHSSASTDILVKLSEDEWNMIQNGTTVTFTITLEYKTVGSRKYSYKASVTYSENTEALRTVSWS